MSRKGRRLGTAWTAIASVAIGGLFVAACGGGAPGGTGPSETPPSLGPLLLTTSDLPAGWVMSTNESSGSFSSEGCPAFDAVREAHDTASVLFTQSRNSDLPQLAQALGWSQQAASLFRAGENEIDECKHLSFESSGQHATGTVTPIAFPQVGTQSAAYQLAIDVDGTQIHFDIVEARKGGYLSLLALGALGQPDLTLLEQFATLALAKLPATTAS